VGKGILHWKLRTDPRLVVMEETNARHLERLAEPVSLVTIDASFISLKILLPAVKGWFPLPTEKISEKNRFVIALIKPQFEAGRKQTARNKGVIRDPEVHQAVLMEVLTFAREHGFGVRGLMRSPLLGPKGNVEFLAWLEPEEVGQTDIPLLVQNVIEKLGIS
jgi:23S rRNA (cytidine1920-2'-O)/16S rRNA (cytidine1409-2'-O)-methyltransferase